jgi:hypothetical protein
MYYGRLHVRALWTQVVRRVAIWRPCVNGRTRRIDSVSGWLELCVEGRGSRRSYPVPGELTQLSAANKDSGN